MSEYFAIVTETGKRKMLEAINIGEKIDIVDFAVGDGGGASYVPSADVTALKNEVWRGKVDTCHISEESGNVLIVETVMPSDVGGFTVREMGIFDQEGDLIAICNVPDTQKVRVTDGVVHEINLIMEIALDNVEGVELVVDPCVLMATKKDIEHLNEKLNKYLGNPGNADNPDGGIGFIEGIEADNVVDAINEVFQSGSKRKNKLVENLTVMGIKASTDETWEELLNKVLDMTDTSNDTVTAGVLLDGYTAHNAAGELITGFIPERANEIVDTTGVTQDSSYTYFSVPEGHYDENSKVRAINSDLSSGIYYLGVGTNFDLKSKFPDDYLRFTTDNFIVVPTVNAGTSGNQGQYTGGYGQTYYASNTKLSITKTYTNGVISINASLKITASATSRSYDEDYPRSKDYSPSISCAVYLVVGEIKSI